MRFVADLIHEVFATVYLQSCFNLLDGVTLSCYTSGSRAVEVTRGEQQRGNKRVLLMLT